MRWALSGSISRGGPCHRAVAVDDCQEYGEESLESLAVQDLAKRQ